MLARIALPLLLAAVSSTPASHYRLDASASAISATVPFLFLASKTARFPKAEGSIALDPGRPESAELEVTLDARALTAGDAVTLKRLKGPKFFDVAKFPTIKFSGHGMKLSGPNVATLDGQLTAHGITKPARLSVIFDHPPKGAAPRDPINFTATTRIDRRDFGMTAYSLIVGRKVEITIRARMVPG